MAYQAPKASTQYIDKSLINEAAERTVLGAVIQDIGLLYTQQLTKDDFAEPRHKEIFVALDKLHSLGVNLGPADIIEHGQNTRKLEAMGGSAYIMGLQEGSYFVTDGYIENGITMLKNASIKRKFNEACNKMIMQGSSAKTREELLAISSNAMNDAFHGLEFSKHKTASDAATLIRERYKSFQDNPGFRSGVMFGIDAIDSFTQGLKPCYMVIGALSSCGKTALACQAFWNMVKSGLKVFFASQEMTWAEIIDRIVSMVTGVGIGRITSGIMTQDEFNKVEKELPRITDLIDKNAVIYDESAMTLSDVRAKAMAFQREHGRIDGILVDYIQNVTVDGIPVGNEYAMVSACSKGLKGLGKDLKCLVVALSQLTPDLNIDEPKPIHLRGSRQIMQDADVIFLMHRLQHRNDRNDGCDIIAGNFAKGRSIGEAKIQLRFETRIMRFDTATEQDVMTTVEWDALQTPESPNKAHSKSSSRTAKYGSAK